MIVDYSEPLEAAKRALDRCDECARLENYYLAMEAAKRAADLLAEAATLLRECIERKRSESLRRELMKGTGS